MAFHVGKVNGFAHSSKGMFLHCKLQNQAKRIMVMRKECIFSGDAVMFHRPGLL
jgi:hypothetical protein